jgi:uncharacterized membrane protein
MLTAFSLVLPLATVLCALVAGFLFAFAVVVMPGLKRLGDREFILAFQQIDGVIQRGQPLFGLVWMGSALALLVAFVLGLGQLDGLGVALISTCTGVYVLGVQLPTFVVNVPLNNALQKVDVGAEDETAWKSAREAFERRWNQWNTFRTGVAVLVTVLLVLLLGRA